MNNKLLKIIMVISAVVMLTEACADRSETAIEVTTQQIENGTYSIPVILQGGSGKATVESPATVNVVDGEITAIIRWSSPNYDYMIVDGVKYFPINDSGNSTFEIPIDGLDTTIEVVADTVAMSSPHEIEYTLTFGDGNFENGDLEASVIETDIASQQVNANAPNWGDMELTDTMLLEYADKFRVDYYGEYPLITINDSDKYLIVYENKEIPNGLDKDIIVLKQPLEKIYLTATSAFDLFRVIGSVDCIRLSGTSADGWYIDEAKEAMENGDILFAGKYSAPDFELIMAENCDLAIESTMIYHNPEIKEQLENAGIPVLVEYSSYESEPLGRLEWIKLYGVLMGKEDKADSYFESQKTMLEDLVLDESEPKTIAFFYVTSNGAVNVRKSQDYVAKMIERAGGKYIFDNLNDGENALSTMTIQMETFYAKARDADYLIYNSTIDGEIYSIDDLITKSNLFADFKAVKNNNVWCTNKSMFQQTTGISDMILDINKIIVDETVDDSELAYLYRLK
jgi:iron complex transport system substrate-binding protein